MDFLETLLHPPFETDPPVKLNISATVIGIIAAILGALGILGYLVAIPAVFAIGAIATGLGVYHPGILGVALVGLVIGFVGAVLETVGGWRMYKANPEGKKLVIYSIAVGAIGSIVYGIGYNGVGGIVIGLIIDFIIYYIVIISRFPNEAPLVAAGTAPPPPPPPPPPSSPPPPPPSSYEPPPPPPPPPAE